jgi:small subunit ribosomal protein S11
MPEEKQAEAQDERVAAGSVERPDAGDRQPKKPRQSVGAENSQETESGAKNGQPVEDAGQVEDGEQPRATGKRKAKGSRAVPAGIAHIKATFNNTTVAITDPRGGVVAWSSAGRAGFKGSRKSTAFAATLVGQDAARQAVGRGMHEVEVRVQGAGSGRESAIRALQSSGLNISVIKDVTPIPHNGCRPRKRRRV